MPSPLPASVSPSPALLQSAHTHTNRGIVSQPILSLVPICSSADGGSVLGIQLGNSWLHAGKISQAINSLQTSDTLPLKRTHTNLGISFFVRIHKHGGSQELNLRLDWRLEQDRQTNNNNTIIQ